jgi:penicillin-binding protein 2
MVPPELEREELPVKPREQDDPKFAAGRIAFLQYLTVGIFLFLVSGFWELQIGNPDFYSERAERNRVKALPILAPRGKILDRDGRVIVDNHASYSLILSRENLKPEHLRTISEGLNLDHEEMEARIRRFERTRPKYEPIIIKEELTPGELAFVEAHRNADGFPEMELIHAHRRLYPKNGLASHVVGYIGEVSEAELNTLEFASYRQGDVIGKAGIERYYNRTLMGVDGQRRVVVDNLGREREVIGIHEATPGQDLQLTLDLDLQVVAELAMEGRRGAVVALDPRNGEVLAMVSRPAFDPNKFAGRIRSGDWRALVEDPERPLLNRGIQAQLAPGSTFKPIVALAGLDTGAIDEGFSVHCPGGATFYGRYFKCHLRGGHGAVGLYRGLVQSCDVYFYNVGNRLGIDKIAEYAELAGFGRKTGVDLPHEAAGLVPSSTWKIRTYRQRWFAGETISVAIGQGALTVTPLQLTYAIGGLAMGGVWHTPHLVKQPQPAASPRVARFDVSHAIEIVNALYGVVNDGGTGARARIPGIEVCGKTGTSQLVSNTAIKSAKAAEALKDNAWFVGFAPRETPEIVVVALFEAGEHGHLAAPIVRDVIKAYFDKKHPAVPPRLVAADHSSGGAAPPGAHH